MKLTYKIADDHRSIECLICGHVSHSREDVLHRYCGHCHLWHTDLESCPWCDEAILPGEPFEVIKHLDEGKVTPRRWHTACSMRSVLGGLNHQLGKCICCGGTEPPDPEGMTRREAALAAVEHFLNNPKHHGCE